MTFELESEAADAAVPGVDYRFASAHDGPASARRTVAEGQRTAAAEVRIVHDGRSEFDETFQAYASVYFPADGETQTTPSVLLTIPEHVNANPRTTPDARAPAGLTVEPGYGQLTVRWTKLTPLPAAVLRYEVQHRLASATGWSPSASVARDAASHTITGLDTGSSYRVRVRIVTGTAGAPSYSHWVSATGATFGAAAPTRLHVVADDASLHLTWQAPSGTTVMAYDVHYTSAPKAGQGAVADDAAVQTGGGATAATGWLAASRTGTAAKQTIAGLSNDTRYRLRVRARSAGGPGAWAHGSGTPATVLSSDATLSGLTAASAAGADGTYTTLALSPAFDAATTGYTATAPAGATHVKLTATVNESNAKVQVGKGSNLAAVESGTESGAIALAAGGNALVVRVTAHDETTTTYTVTVTRPAAPQISIAAGAGVTEGADATFTLTASPASASALAVAVNVAQSGDFAQAALGARTVTVAAGATTAAFTVATVDDAVDEPDGSVTATLAAGAGYTVSASRGAATVAVADDDEPPPEVSIAAGAEVTEGTPAPFTLTADRAPAAALAVSVTVTQSGDFAEGSALGTRTVTIAAGATTAPFTVATVNDVVDEPDGSVTATLTAGAGYTVSASQATATVAVADNDVPNAPEIRPDRRNAAKEGRDGALSFRVRLSHASTEPVTVDYASAEGAATDDWSHLPQATAGADFTHVTGMLVFAPGETRKYVYLPILDDAIDEGSEIVLMRYSNPQGGVLADRDVTEGIIWNDDHLQAMSLARFGRMAAGHLTDAVSDRLDAEVSPGAHVTLAGQSLDLTNTDDAEALANTVTGLARAFGASEAPAVQDDDPFARPRDRAAAWSDLAATTGHSMTAREVLLGSTFHLASPGGGAGPGLAAWGRVAHGSFDGEHADDTGTTRVDAEVLTGTLGADADWGRLLAGVAISLSEGDGAFASPEVDVGKAGTLESTLTTVSPYLRFKLSERVSAWGLVGFGTGDMTIGFDDGSMAPIRTDTSLRLGALGARGALMEQDATGGMDLALKADVFTVRTESDAAANSAATVTDVGRVRLVLDGGRAFALSETATFRPGFEVGLRVDGGDAESGAGLELGGGVAFADTASGLSIEAKARMLVAHADSDYEEWGASATARLDPGERGRGLSFSLLPVIGSAASATERLWGAERPRELAPGAEFEAARGLAAEAGYGLALFGGRFTGTPNAGLGLADGGARDWRIGWRLTSTVPGDPGFEVNLDATRREPANDGAAEHGVMLRGLMRW